MAAHQKLNHMNRRASAKRENIMQQKLNGSENEYFTQSRKSAKQSSRPSGGDQSMRYAKSGEILGTNTSLG